MDDSEEWWDNSASATTGGEGRSEAAAEQHHTTRGIPSEEGRLPRDAVPYRSGQGGAPPTTDSFSRVSQPNGGAMIPDTDEGVHSMSPYGGVIAGSVLGIQATSDAMVRSNSMMYNMMPQQHGYQHYQPVPQYPNHSSHSPYQQPYYPLPPLPPNIMQQHPASHNFPQAHYIPPPPPSHQPISPHHFPSHRGSVNNPLRTREGGYYSMDREGYGNTKNMGESIDQLSNKLMKSDLNQGNNSSSLHHQQQQQHIPSSSVHHQHHPYQQHNTVGPHLGPQSSHYIPPSPSRGNMSMGVQLHGSEIEPYNRSHMPVHDMTQYPNYPSSYNSGYPLPSQFPPQFHRPHVSAYANPSFDQDYGAQSRYQDSSGYYPPSSSPYMQRNSYQQPSTQPLMYGEQHPFYTSQQLIRDESRQCSSESQSPLPENEEQHRVEATQYHRLPQYVSDDISKKTDKQPKSEIHENQSHSQTSQQQTKLKAKRKESVLSADSLENVIQSPMSPVSTESPLSPEYKEMSSSSSVPFSPTPPSSPAQGAIPKNSESRKITSLDKNSDIREVIMYNNKKEPDYEDKIHKRSFNVSNFVNQTSSNISDSISANDATYIIENNDKSEDEHDTTHDSSESQYDNVPETSSKVKPFPFDRNIVEEERCESPLSSIRVGDVGFVRATLDTPQTLLASTRLVQATLKPSAKPTTFFIALESKFEMPEFADYTVKNNDIPIEKGTSAEESADSETKIYPKPAEDDIELSMDQDSLMENITKKISNPKDKATSHEDASISHENISISPANYQESQLVMRHYVEDWDTIMNDQDGEEDIDEFFLVLDSDGKAAEYSFPSGASSPMSSCPEHTFEDTTQESENITQFSLITEEDEESIGTPLPPSITEDSTIFDDSLDHTLLEHNELSVESEESNSVMVPRCSTPTKDINPIATSVSPEIPHFSILSSALKSSLAKNSNTFSSDSSAEHSQPMETASDADKCSDTKPTTSEESSTSETVKSSSPIQDEDQSTEKTPASTSAEEDKPPKRPSASSGKSLFQSFLGSGKGFVRPSQARVALGNKHIVKPSQDCQGNNTGGKDGDNDKKNSTSVLPPFETSVNFIFINTAEKMMGDSIKGRYISRDSKLSTCSNNNFNKKHSLSEKNNNLTNFENIQLKKDLSVCVPNKISKIPVIKGESEDLVEDNSSSLHSVHISDSNNISTNLIADTPSKYINDKKNYICNETVNISKSCENNQIADEQVPHALNAVVLPEIISVSTENRSRMTDCNRSVLPSCVESQVELQVIFTDNASDRTSSTTKTIQKENIICNKDAKMDTTCTDNKVVMRRPKRSIPIFNRRSCDITDYSTHYKDNIDATNTASIKYVTNVTSINDVTNVTSTIDSIKHKRQSRSQSSIPTRVLSRSLSTPACSDDTKVSISVIPISNATPHSRKSMIPAGHVITSPTITNHITSSSDNNVETIVIPGQNININSNTKRTPAVTSPPYALNISCEKGLYIGKTEADAADDTVNSTATTPPQPPPLPPPTESKRFISGTALGSLSFDVHCNSSRSQALPIKESSPVAHVHRTGTTTFMSKIVKLPIGKNLCEETSRIVGGSDDPVNVTVAGRDSSGVTNGASDISEHLPQITNKCQAISHITAPTRIARSLKYHDTTSNIANIHVNKVAPMSSRSAPSLNADAKLCVASKKRSFIPMRSCPLASKLRFPSVVAAKVKCVSSVVPTNTRAVSVAANSCHETPSSTTCSNDNVSANTSTHRINRDSSKSTIATIDFKDQKCFRPMKIQRIASNGNMVIYHSLPSILGDDNLCNNTKIFFSLTKLDLMSKAPDEIISKLLLVFSKTRSFPLSESFLPDSDIESITQVNCSRQAASKLVPSAQETRIVSSDCIASSSTIPNSALTISITPDFVHTSTVATTCNASTIIATPPTNITTTTTTTTTTRNAMSLYRHCNMASSVSLAPERLLSGAISSSGVCSEQQNLAYRSDDSRHLNSKSSNTDLHIAGNISTVTEDLVNIGRHDSVGDFSDSEILSDRQIFSKNSCDSDVEISENTLSDFSDEEIIISDFDDNDVCDSSEEISQPLYIPSINVDCSHDELSLPISKLTTASCSEEVQPVLPSLDALKSVERQVSHALSISSSANVAEAMEGLPFLKHEDLDRLATIIANRLLNNTPVNSGENILSVSARTDADTLNGAQDCGVSNVNSECGTSLSSGGDCGASVSSGDGTSPITSCGDGVLSVISGDFGGIISGYSITSSDSGVSFGSGASSIAASTCGSVIANGSIITGVTHSVDIFLEKEDLNQISGTVVKTIPNVSDVVENVNSMCAGDIIPKSSYEIESSLKRSNNELNNFAHHPSNDSVSEVTAELAFPTINTGHTTNDRMASYRVNDKVIFDPKIMLQASSNADEYFQEYSRETNLPITFSSGKGPNCDNNLITKDNILLNEESGNKRESSEDQQSPIMNKKLGSCDKLKYPQHGIATCDQTSFVSIVPESSNESNVIGGLTGATYGVVHKSESGDGTMPLANSDNCVGLVKQRRPNAYTLPHNSQPLERVNYETISSAADDALLHRDGLNYKSRSSIINIERNSCSCNNVLENQGSQSISPEMVVSSNSSGIQPIISSVSSHTPLTLTELAARAHKKHLLKLCCPASYNDDMNNSTSTELIVNSSNMSNDDLNVIESIADTAKYSLHTEENNRDSGFESITKNSIMNHSPHTYNMKPKQFVPTRYSAVPKPLRVLADRAYKKRSADSAQIPPKHCSNYVICFPNDGNTLTKSSLNANVYDGRKDCNNVVELKSIEFNSLKNISALSYNSNRKVEMSTENKEKVSAGKHESINENCVTSPVCSYISDITNSTNVQAAGHESTRNKDCDYKLSTISVSQITIPNLEEGTNDEKKVINNLIDRTYCKISEPPLPDFLENDLIRSKNLVANFADNVTKKMVNDFQVQPQNIIAESKENICITSKIKIPMGNIESLEKGSEVLMEFPVTKNIHRNISKNVIMSNILDSNCGDMFNTSNLKEDSCSNLNNESSCFQQSFVNNKSTAENTQVQSVMACWVANRPVIDSGIARVKEPYKSLTTDLSIISPLVNTSQNKECSTKPNFLQDSPSKYSTKMNECNKTFVNRLIDYKDYPDIKSDNEVSDAHSEIGFGDTKLSLTGSISKRREAYRRNIRNFCFDDNLVANESSLEVNDYEKMRQKTLNIRNQVVSIVERSREELDKSDESFEENNWEIEGNFRRKISIEKENSERKISDSSGVSSMSGSSCRKISTESNTSTPVDDWNWFPGRKISYGDSSLRKMSDASSGCSSGIGSLQEAQDNRRISLCSGISGLSKIKEESSPLNHVNVINSEEDVSQLPEKPDTPDGFLPTPPPPVWPSFTDQKPPKPPRRSTLGILYDTTAVRFNELEVRNCNTLIAEKKLVNKRNRRRTLHTFKNIFDEWHKRSDESDVCGSLDLLSSHETELSQVKCSSDAALLDCKSTKEEYFDVNIPDDEESASITGAFDSAESMNIPEISPEQNDKNVGFFQVNDSDSIDSDETGKMYSFATNNASAKFPRNLKVEAETCQFNRNVHNSQNKNKLSCDENKYYQAKVQRIQSLASSSKRDARSLPNLSDVGEANVLDLDEPVVPYRKRRNNQPISISQQHTASYDVLNEIQPDAYVPRSEINLKELSERNARQSRRVTHAQSDDALLDKGYAGYSGSDREADMEDINMDFFEPKNKFRVSLPRRQPSIQTKRSRRFHQIKRKFSLNSIDKSKELKDSISTSLQRFKSAKQKFEKLVTKSLKKEPAPVPTLVKASQILQAPHEYNFNLDDFTHSSENSSTGHILSSTSYSSSSTNSSKNSSKKSELLNINRTYSKVSEVRHYYQESHEVPDFDGSESSYSWDEADSDFEYYKMGPNSSLINPSSSFIQSSEMEVFKRGPNSHSNVDQNVSRIKTSPRNHTTEVCPPPVTLHTGIRSSG